MHYVTETYVLHVFFMISIKFLKLLTNINK